MIERKEKCPACGGWDTKPFFPPRWHCDKCNERWVPKGVKK